MPKIDLETVANLQNEASVVATINANNVLIENALDDVLFREGTGSESANSMIVDLDMNAKRILNLPAPVDDLEPARHGDLAVYVTDAEAAQTAAESAQAGAVAAEAAAVVAKNAAVVAQAGAELAEDGAEAVLVEIETHSINSGVSTPVALGTVSSGSQTPEPVDGALQTMTNGGASTIVAPTTTGWYRLVWQNNATAGIISLSGFDATFDDSAALTHVVNGSKIELMVVNDGVAKVAQVMLLVDATP